MFKHFFRAISLKKTIWSEGKDAEVLAMPANGSIERLQTIFAVNQNLSAVRSKQIVSPFAA
jgi:hypothetical protein